MTLELDSTYTLKRDFEVLFCMRSDSVQIGNTDSESMKRDMKVEDRVR
jgi:hypothetical protein